MSFNIAAGTERVPWSAGLCSVLQVLLFRTWGLPDAGNSVGYVYIKPSACVVDVAQMSVALR